MMQCQNYFRFRLIFLVALFQHARLVVLCNRRDCQFLIQVMTALGNVTLPMIFAGMHNDAAVEKGLELLELDLAEEDLLEELLLLLFPDLYDDDRGLELLELLDRADDDLLDEPLEL